MKPMKQTTIMVACVLPALLMACGGGGDGTSAGAAATPAPVAGAAQGIYIGTTSDGREIDTIVLENDQFYTMYGNTVANGFLVAGFVQGDGKSNNGKFTSTNAVDSSSNNTRVAASVNATYTPGVNLTGSLVESAGTVNFSSTPIAPSVINYNSAANLADIAGNWNLTSLRGFPTTFTISSTGALSASSSGCIFSGSITPRASGKNVFDVSIDFGPAPCLIPNQSIKGIAVDYVTTSGQRQLIVAGIDNTRLNTAAFFGVR
jgi:hypothetical protein